MRAFVTGSTGFIGNNLVAALRADDHEVVALVRDIEKAQRVLGHLQVTFVQGDMLDVAAFADHLAGCDVLFHTAAYFREYYGRGDHWPKLQAINVDATLDLLEAAEAQGVGKAVYVSSAGVIGKTADGSPADESAAPDDEIMQNLYFRSKALAEERIAAWLPDHDLPVTLMLPAAIFGPGDTAPTTAGKMLLDFLHGKLPAVPTGGFVTVDVRDVVAAMLTAVEQGGNGERYIIADQYHSIADILKLTGRITGRTDFPLQLNEQQALFVAQASEFVARLTRSDPLVTVSAVRTLNAKRPLDASKARRELGFEPRPFAETLRDEIRWFMDYGYIKPKIKREIARASSASV